MWGIFYKILSVPLNIVMVLLLFFLFFSFFLRNVARESRDIAKMMAGNMFTMGGHLCDNDSFLSI